MLGQLSRNNFSFQHKAKQKHRFTSIFICFLLTLACIFTPDLAWSTESETVATNQTAEIAEPKAGIEPEAVERLTVNTTLIAEMDPSITVTLDGETLQSTEVHRAENGGLYVNAMPIFQTLGNDVEFDAETKALIVRRSQDGVVMELYTDTGIVKADGRALGKLQHFGEVAENRYILTPNAIAVLSGAAGKFNSDDNRFDFELDPRLRVATGFEIYVNDIALGTLDPAPRSVGSILLLPLLPIAQELGHDVRVLAGGEEVQVRRAQDSAQFKINLSTGLITLRDNPIGITKDVAYIDETNLLLPVSAIETLTGTYVSVEGGSNRIDIDLDERLSGAIKPMASVDDVAKDTPFTPETLSFELGPDTINQVQFEARAGRFNGRLRYEIPDIPDKAAELEPTWLSLDFAHTSGATGSIGDYAADLRELDGVGTRRIRGAAIVKTTDKGRWAVAAGMPSNGAKTISSDQGRQTFGGFAAGVRYASRDGWEAGAAVKKDGLSNDQMAVLSAISGRLGRTKDKKFQWDAQADLGYFNGDAREKSIDVRARLNGRYEVNKTVSVDSFVEYSGSEFLRSNLNDENRQDEISEALNPDIADEEENIVPDNRSAGMDQLNIGANLRVTPDKDLGVFTNPAASIRVQTANSGAFVKHAQGSTLNTIGGSVATGLGKSGVSISLDSSYYQLKQRDTGLTERGHQFSARAIKRFDDFSVRGQYQYDKKSGEEAQQSLSASVSMRSFNVPIAKEAHLAVSPSVNGIWTNGATQLRGGVIASFNSGKLLGEKTRLDASLGVLQSFNSERENQQDQFLSVSLARRVRLGKNMAVGLSYRNDLRGEHRVGLLLNGRFDFNEKRKFRDTAEGRGVLKGRAFLDANRDGVQQEEETPVGFVLVRIKGTRLALRTDRAGYFTIQNIKQGIYEVQIDAGSLPIGYDLSDDISTKVTIDDGMISDVPLPIVQKGQIRGFAFDDANNNGEYEKSEDRVEGAKLILRPKDGGEDVTVYSTSFGQFAFDDLPDGIYEIKVPDQPKQKIQGLAPVTVNLSDSKDLMAKISVPLKRVKTVQFADDQSRAPPDKPNTMEPGPLGPAPP